MSQIPPKIEDLYASTVERIPEADAPLAHLVLIWLIHCKGTLSIGDLQHAVAVTPDTYQFDHDTVVSEDDLLHICRGLITIDVQNKQVRLVRE